jgi:hypothetical protein
MALLDLQCLETVVTPSARPGRSNRSRGCPRGTSTLSVALC